MAKDKSFDKEEKLEAAPVVATRKTVKLDAFLAERPGLDHYSRALLKSQRGQVKTIEEWDAEMKALIKKPIT